MKLKHTYQLSKVVGIERADGHVVALDTLLGRIDISTPGNIWQLSLENIPAQGIALDDLAHLVMQAGYKGGLADLFFVVDRMLSLGILQICIEEPAQTHAILVAGSMLFRMPTRSCEAGRRYKLSRFAYLRAVEGRMVLESPRCLAAMHLHSAEAIAWVNGWAEAQVFQQDDIHRSEVEAEFADLLLGLEFLVEVDAEDKTEEETEKSYRYWEFHDLLFHGRSRIGRHSEPVGATYPFRGQYPPEPALPPVAAELPLIPLFMPDIANLIENDHSFTKVLEYRRSIRAYNDDAPITLEQLGEFLYRSARVRAVHAIDEARENYYETSSRPYPSGGGSYEFELYVTVNQCDGLVQGIYHYDADAHGLRLMQTEPYFVQALLRDAWASAAQTVHPQVLITYAPRFARLAWKYRGMGYSASLKNAGVLYQTMYLVATAMGLAPCALGNGNAFLFSKAIGSDYYLNSSTAEFMLGSMPQPKTPG